jgi:hypothetical protein
MTPVGPGSEALAQPISDLAAQTWFRGASDGQQIALPLKDAGTAARTGAAPWRRFRWIEAKLDSYSSICPFCQSARLSVASEHPTQLLECSDLRFSALFAR